MLEKIRYFQAVVRCGSFSKAADLCSISQSAISQQVQALERELQTRLLERKHRSFTLTPAGEFFYASTQNLVEDAERIVRETRAIGHPESDVLRIGILHGSEFLCAKAVRSFRTKYPQIHLDLFFGSHEQLFQTLRADQCDLVISDQRRAFSASYNNVILCEKPWRLETGLPIEEETVSGRRFGGKSCIGLDDSPSEQEYCRDVLGLDGPFMLAGSMEEARLLAASGSGVFACTEPDTLPVLEKEGKKLFRTYCAFSKTWNRKDSLLQFLELIHKKN